MSYLKQGVLVRDVESLEEGNVKRRFNGKEPACNTREMRFHPWLRKIPWRRERLPTPVFLPGESHGHRSLEGYSQRGCKRLDTTEQLTLAFSIGVEKDRERGDGKEGQQK